MPSGLPTTPCSPGSPRCGPESGDGQWQFQVRDGSFQDSGGGGTALVFEVRPEVLAFAKGRFGQTRHSFP